MTRAEIISRFRQENTSITTNVASDALLNSWCEIGNLEICIKARLIKGDTTFSAGVGESEYNLDSRITNFYDIDELPGGGVAYNNKRLTLESIASLDSKRPSWRTASNGTPTDYYRRGKYLVLGTPPDTANDIQVYTILIPDSFDSDTKTPFNQLSHLEPFHYALVLYLNMRIYTSKLKDLDKASMAMNEYNQYVEWLKKETNRGIYKDIKMRPATGYKGTGRTRR